MTVKVGYIGLDHHHRDPYLQTISRLDADVVASADPEGKRPGELGVDSLEDKPWYESVDALIDNEDFDVIWVTLSNSQTPAVLEKGVDAGLDIVTEKPGARRAHELEAVRDSITGSSATVTFAYTWREHPISKELRRRATNGLFDSLRGFDAQFFASGVESRRTDHYLFDADESRGGILQWLGVHWIDLLPWLVDEEIVRVNATMSTPETVEVEDVAILQVELSSGAVGTIRTGYLLSEGRYNTSIDIYGDMGRAYWDPMGETFGFDGETTVTLESEEWPSTPRRQLTYEYQPAPGYGGRWGQSFFEQFLEARVGNAANPAPVEDAITVLSVLDAAYKSAEQNSWKAVQ